MAANDNAGVPAPVFIVEDDLVALGPFDRSHIDMGLPPARQSGLTARSPTRAEGDS